ncbi:hypothetical protein [Nesterenkonia alba]|uniref:hypothetical protein n=1 Tax=Nesterenkonia alba TaxID=515814 RepID=UPI0003B66A8B|nr:hypothetical protein [Nesterenkonia alba]
MSVTRTDPETARALARPTWLRAGLAALFGVFTLVWHGNETIVELWSGEDLLVARIAIVVYLVLSATAIWEAAKQDVVPTGLRSALALGAAVRLLSGVAVVFVTTTTAIAVAAGAGLLICGAAEAVAARRSRAGFVPARDHTLVGTLEALAGVLLVSWWGLEIEGVVGIIGMAAILTAALLGVAAGGLTHELRVADKRQQRQQQDQK